MIDFSASVTDMSDDDLADHGNEVNLRLGALMQIDKETFPGLDVEQRKEVDRLFDRVIEINTEIVARRNRKDQAILDTATDFHRELDQ